ncbi:hypothetical protein OG259_00980 [Streptomyces sp. NBC_00250]|uniref:hypothetical protein n=1 Tax=Streptomyces sp. NBC_00250 TaxID=2903641 RepID=UPI002E2A0F45|nr:hypothetical protein [Streptomyces sp. NBC_00250]
MSPADFHTTHKIDYSWGVTRSSLSLRILASFGIATMLIACQATPSSESEAERPNRRELVNIEDRILDYAERAKARMPYTPPDEAHREHLVQGVGHLLDGDTRKAEELLRDVGLKVTGLTDATTGRRYDEVAARNVRGVEAGWGRLYVNADTGVRWSVQVPHPVADSDTETLAARLLEDTPGGALVLAGAHRTAGRGDGADVAHRTDSAFHAIVAELQKRGIPGAQLHGFARAADRPYDAVISTGATRTAPAEATALADRMQGDGLRVCRGWSDRCPLEGTTNVQGKSAKRHDATFLHVELAPRTRGNGSQAEKARTALSGLLATWSEAGQ